MKNTVSRASCLLIVASFVTLVPVLAAHAGQGSTDLPSQASMWPGGTWSPPVATYGTKQDLQVRVPMSDGVVVKADISYPIDPTTRSRAPGPGGSFGFFSDRDAKDGAELVAWAAAKVENSNGVVGLHGDSYMAITQMFTVAAAGPGSPVKAMSASRLGAEFYPETYFAGGIPTQTMNFQKVIGNLMHGDTAASGAATLADVLAGGDKAYYRDFWKARTVGNLVQRVVDADIPILLYSSSGDIYAQSSMDLYAYPQNAFAKQPIYGPMHTDVPATGRYQIIFGQGGHCQNQDVTIQLEWFENG
jgi:predicted acyl esterase